MKPLLETPITRERRAVGDWVPSTVHDTLEGRNDFHARQLARIEAARKQQRANVREFKRGTK